MQVFVGDIVERFFVGGDTLEPAERRDHRKQQVQFGVLSHRGLQEEGGPVGLESDGQPVGGDFDQYSAPLVVSA